jgi:hypothetical protein
MVLGDDKAAAKILNKEEELKEHQSKDAFFAERMIRAEIALRQIMPLDEKGKPTGFDPTPWYKGRKGVLGGHPSQGYRRRRHRHGV